MEKGGFKIDFLPSSRDEGKRQPKYEDEDENASEMAEKLHQCITGVVSQPLKAMIGQQL